MSDPTTKLSKRLRGMYIEMQSKNPGGVEGFDTPLLFEVVEALEAPPVSEPVAWMDSGGAVIGAAMKRYKEMSIHIDRRESAKDYTIPLFTHPTKE